MVVSRTVMFAGDPPGLQTSDCVGSILKIAFASSTKIPPGPHFLLSFIKAKENILYNYFYFEGSLLCQPEGDYAFLPRMSFLGRRQKEYSSWSRVTHLRLQESKIGVIRLQEHETGWSFFFPFPFIALIKWRCTHHPGEDLSREDPFSKKYSRYTALSSDLNFYLDCLFTNLKIRLFLF